MENQNQSQTVTLEMVETAKQVYENLLKQYNQENTTTVRLCPAPDGYRGDFHCIDFLDEVTFGPAEGHFPYARPVYKNGVEVGKYEVYYGNSGKSDRVASSDFRPAPGVTVVMED